MAYELTRLGESAYVLRVQGFLTDVEATQIVDRIAEMLGETGDWTGLNDWAAATGYTSTARRTLTSFVVSRRSQYRRIVVLAPKIAIIKMALSVANVALGGFVSVTHDRKEYEDSLRAFGSERSSPVGSYDAHG